MDRNPDSPDLRESVRRIRELEQRVRALEECVGSNPVPPPSFERAPLETPSPAAPPRGDAVGAFPIFGQALLAIA